jgi:hypothetical protein
VCFSNHRGERCRTASLPHIHSYVQVKENQMNFARIDYRTEKGDVTVALLMNPIPVIILGKRYLHGKACNQNGLKLRPPHKYASRHPEGDGIVWKMIPLDKITHNTPMYLVKGRLRYSRDAVAAARS